MPGCSYSVIKNVNLIIYGSHLWIFISGKLRGVVVAITYCFKETKARCNVKSRNITEYASVISTVLFQMTRDMNSSSSDHSWYTQLRIFYAFYYRYLQKPSPVSINTIVRNQKLVMQKTSSTSLTITIKIAINRAKTQAKRQSKPERSLSISSKTFIRQNYIKKIIFILIFYIRLQHQFYYKMSACSSSSMLDCFIISVKYSFHLQINNYKILLKSECVKLPSWGGKTSTLRTLLVRLDT